MAFFVSYLGHDRWSFRGNGVPGRVTIQRFLIVSLSGLCLSEGMVYLLTESVGIRPEWAVLSAIVLVAAYSFVLSRTWVFWGRPVSSAP